jgi:hypothetical protein
VKFTLLLAVISIPTVVSLLGMLLHQRSDKRIFKELKKMKSELEKRVYCGIRHMRQRDAARERASHSEW